MDGILIVDKPKKYTSHDIVNVARKVLDTRRIGHIGTLDPNATGVLVLCVNKATKLVKYFQEHTKTYIATIIIGIDTDTNDLTGKVINEADASHLTEKEIKSALKTFLGKQMQVPPNYSAVKIEGKKLYELARRDIILPNLEPREVEIFSIDDVQIAKNVESIEIKATFKVSKGTYIRSIARDLGIKLGNYGTLKDLIRTKIDHFKLENAISIEDLKDKKYELLDPFDFLNMPKITVDDLTKQYIQNGRFLDLDMFPEKTDTIIYSRNHEVLAIYYYDEQKNAMRVSVKWI